MQKLTIVMYHYVRPILHSSFPEIKGLELDAFSRQLDYLDEKYTIVTSEDVIKATQGKSSLPANSCWLTFDDGYKDHFSYVMPELIKRGLTGAFFPPKIAIQTDNLLDVNAIHHILASCQDIILLKEKMNALLEKNGIPRSQLDKYRKDYGVANRWDNKNIIYIKRMLQHAISEDIRREVLGRLFKDYVGVSQEKFSKELYMSVSEIKSMIENNMYIGSHGSSHCWLNKISIDEQRKDIKDSLVFLEEVGASTKDWVMCYPYGGYNDDTLLLLKEMGASIGITIEARVADLLTDNPLKLPRLNTNDFPQ